MNKLNSKSLTMSKKDSGNRLCVVIYMGRSVSELFKGTYDTIEDN